MGIDKFLLNWLKTNEKIKRKEKPSQFELWIGAKIFIGFDQFARCPYLDGLNLFWCLRLNAVIGEHLLQANTLRYAADVYREISVESLQQQK